MDALRDGKRKRKEEKKQSGANDHLVHHTKCPFSKYIALRILPSKMFQSSFVMSSPPRFPSQTPLPPYLQLLILDLWCFAKLGNLLLLSRRGWLGRLFLLGVLLVPMK